MWLLNLTALSSDLTLLNRTSVRSPRYIISPCETNKVHIIKTAPIIFPERGGVKWVYDRKTPWSSPTATEAERTQCPYETAREASLTRSRTSLALTLLLPVATPVATEAMKCQTLFYLLTCLVSGEELGNSSTWETGFQWWCANACEITWDVLTYWRPLIIQGSVWQLLQAENRSTV